jgi:hypothetical protein
MIILCTSTYILLGLSNSRTWYGRGMWHKRERREMHPEFLWGNLQKRNHLEDLGTDGRLTFNISRKYCFFR